MIHSAVIWGAFGLMLLAGQADQPDQRGKADQPIQRGKVDQPFEREKRIAYIESLLQAFQTADPKTISNTRSFVNAIERSRCRSAFPRLKTICLIEAASKNCEQRRWGREERARCNVIADAVVSNKLGEKEFIDKQSRLDIMNSQGDYRTAIEQELKRRYAELVMEFGMSGEVAQEQLAARLDEYCQSQALRRDLTWQYCVAGVAWFIGTSQKP